MGLTVGLETVTRLFKGAKTLGKRKKPAWGEAQDFEEYQAYDKNQDLKDDLQDDLEDTQDFLEDVQGVMIKMYQKTNRRERHHQKQHPKRQENWL